MEVIFILIIHNNNGTNTLVLLPENTNIPKYEYSEIYVAYIQPPRNLILIYGFPYAYTGGRRAEYFSIENMSKILFDHKGYSAIYQITKYIQSESEVL